MTNSCKGEQRWEEEKETQPDVNAPDVELDSMLAQKWKK